MIIFLFLTCALAFTGWQVDTIRACIKKNGPPDAVFIDVAMNMNYAQTDMMRRIVSIDARRFECCPNSFYNVVIHELEHCKGRNHNNISGDPMAYILTVDRLGYIIDDEPPRVKERAT